MSDITITIGTGRTPLRNMPDDTFSLRSFSSLGYLDSDGLAILAGSVKENYRETTGGTLDPTTKIPAYPTLILPASTDASNDQTGTWTTVIVDSTGRQRDILFEDYEVPHYLGSAITLLQLTIHNEGTTPVRDRSTLTRSQIELLIATAVSGSGAPKATDATYGITRLSVAAALSSAPIAAGDNDPRLAAASTTNRGTVLTTTSNSTVVSTDDARLADETTVNVKSHGAVGDGVADDTAAIAAAIAVITAAGKGVLYFPAGTYKTTGGFTISVPMKIYGDGRGDAHFEYAANAAFLTKITSTSGTNVMFLVTANHARFEGLYLRNNAASLPTAGCAVKITNATDYLQKVDFYDCTIERFYDNIDYEVGDNWRMHNCYILSPVRYGIHIQNLVVPDAGGWTISDSEFLSDLGIVSGNIAIFIESCGGARINNTNILCYETAVKAIASTTTILLISDCCFENLTGDAIIVEDWGLVSINNTEFGMYLTTTARAINFLRVDRSSINNILMRGITSGTIAGILLTDCTGIELHGVMNSGYQNIVEYAGTYAPDFLRGFIFNPPSLSNSWANLGGGYSTAGVTFYNGRVELRGVVTGGTLNTVIFNIPAAWRPPGHMVFPAFANNTMCWIFINSNGDVSQLAGSTNVNVSLDGVSYIP